MKFQQSNVHFHASDQFQIYYYPILNIDWLIAQTQQELPISAKDEMVLHFSNQKVTYWELSDAGRVCVNVYHKPTAFELFKNSMSDSFAKSSWLAASYLTENNILTPEPLAYIEKKQYGLVSQSWYLCRYEEQTTVNDYFIQAQSYTPAMSNTVSKVVDFILNLKSCGISHGRLSANNLLLAENDIKVVELSHMQFHLSDKKLSTLWNLDVEYFMESWRERYDIYKHFQQAFLQRGIVCKG